MAEDRFILTPTGYETIQRDLDDLLEQSKGMAEQMAEVHDDTEFGEEATYQNVMEDKERLEQRIAHLRGVLLRAEVISDEDPDPTRADPGEKVTVWDFSAKAEVEFQLLSTEEVARGLAGISTESPVGQALLGRRVGDVVEVDVPDGKVKYALRKIERPQF
ncbi:MAG: GreA/GreB family elongation factor [Chloroflexota bacterium]